MKRKVCHLLLFLLISQVACSLEQEDDKQTSSHHFLPRPCLTDCDCNRMMIPFTRDEHVCYQCVALASNQESGTCQKVAACAANHICSLLPRIKIDEGARAELDQPTSISSFHCLSKATNETISHKPPRTCLSDEDCAFTGLAPFEQISYTMTGYCLSSGYCRYPLYGLEVGKEKRHQQSALNHSECEWQPRKCKHKAECFAGPSEMNAGHSFLVECNQIEYKCEQNNRLNANISTLLPVCQNEEDCNHWAQLNDPLFVAGNCYSCIKGDEMQTGRTGRCVKTDSNCTSGMCLSGKCLAQACHDDLDCINVSGKQSDCHVCDKNKGTCLLRQACEGGTVCTRDHGADRYCASIISPCSLFRINITEDQRARRTCLGLASGGLGYYRSTDYLHRISTSRYNQYIQNSIRTGIHLEGMEIGLTEVSTLKEIQEKNLQQQHQQQQQQQINQNRGGTLATTTTIPIKQTDDTYQVGIKLKQASRPVFIGTRVAISQATSSVDGGFIQNPTQSTALSTPSSEGGERGDVNTLGINSPSIIHSNSITNNGNYHILVTTPTSPVFIETDEEVPVNDVLLYVFVIIAAVVIIIIAYCVYLQMRSLDLPIYFKKTMKRYLSFGTGGETTAEVEQTAADIRTQEALGIIPVNNSINNNNTKNPRTNKKKLKIQRMN